ncbi:MAG: hypothetical protein ACUVX8_07325 [Candidatus Zipacnadales bacterium]
MTPHTGFLCLTLTAAVLLTTPVLSQGEQGETLDNIQQDIDLLEQMQEYEFTLEQLQQILPILQELEAKRAALEAYKRSEEAVAPARALRQALLEGKPTDNLYEPVQAVWEKLDELETAHQNAVAPAMKKIAALLTEQQLKAVTEEDTWAYDQADEIFATLDSARGFNDETFIAWRDRTARQIAFRAAGEGPEKGAQVEADVKQFLDKVRRLKEDEFYEKSDELFDELTALLVKSQPPPLREVAEARAAEALEYIFQSERALKLIEAQIKARAGQ